MMKDKIILSILLLGSASLSFAATQASNECNRLYVLHAKQGQVSDVGNNKVLTLSGTLPNIYYFCDRPVRQHGIESMGNFIKQWSVGKDNFKADNPNAAMIATIDAKKSTGYYDRDVVLSNPQYDAQKKQLSFVINKLDNQEQLKDQTINNVSLFIDDSYFPGD